VRKPGGEIGAIVFPHHPGRWRAVRPRTRTAAPYDASLSVVMASDGCPGSLAICETASAQDALPLAGGGPWGRGAGVLHHEDAGQSGRTEVSWRSWWSGAAAPRPSPPMGCAPTAQPWASSAARTGRKSAAGLTTGSRTRRSPAW